MTTWRFDDGSVLRSGGRVTGKGPAAAALRSRIADERPVYVLPLPSTPVTLIVDSDYLLDCLAVEVQFATMTKFTQLLQARRRRRSARVTPAASCGPLFARDRTPFGTVH